MEDTYERCNKAMLKGQEKYLEREHSVAKNLSQLIDCIPGSLYWKDSEGRYLGCNMFMVKTAGLKSLNEIIGKTDFELWPTNAKKIRENDVSVMESNKPIFLEEKIRIHSGEIMYFASNKVPLTDELDNVVGIICNSLDITKLKKTEKELKEAKEKAELSDSAKSIFIQNMQHDIRTPFAGIFGFTKILADQETNIKKKHFLQDIATSAKELLDYCDNILDFSKIEHGTAPILEAFFDIRKIANSVAEIESIAAMHKKLNLSITYDDKIPKAVVGDPQRLKRILLNLVSNAIKFTGSGKVTVSIKLATLNNTKRTCIIKFIICDTGIGIPVDKQHIIYEKFVRCTSSNKGIYKGQGLGLSIVKQLIEELDGDIHLKSEVGKGATFTFLLPFKLPLTYEEIIDES